MSKIQQCLLTLLICLISSGCSTPEHTDFQWLDISAVHRAPVDHTFEPGATWGDLAKAYIDLKHQCRATVFGVDELERAQKRLKELD